MNDIPLLGGLWLLAWAIQLGFHLGIFAPLIFYRPQKRSNILTLPSVSVVICARNEALHLPKLLEKLRTQCHPDFEVILVDDRSEDASPIILHHWQQIWPALQVVRIEKTPLGLDPKKYALRRGLAKAQKEVIVLTDADGYPASDKWLALLAQYFDENTDIVLGVSPYERRPGLLNACIQFETFYAALQYLGLAWAGWPYMGVGRNMAYRRALYLHQQAIIYQYQHITGGDDDLWISRVAHKKNTQICLNPEAYVISYPKLRWKEWFAQKKRHLSVSKYYKPFTKWILGTLHASHLIFWLGILGGALACQTSVFMSLMLFLGLGREFVLGLTWFAIKKKHTLFLPVWLCIPFDFLYVFYIFITGIIAQSQKQILWKK